MDKYKNIKRARHHIVFLSALIVGAILINFLNNIDLKQNRSSIKTLENRIAPKITIKRKDLTTTQKEWAKTAWIYFENNYNQNTGLVNSVDNFPSTTLWDTGNYIMALISAYRLDIINKVEFNNRLSKILTTLANLKLYKGLLPNKVYNTKTIKMTNYSNKELKNGIGYSSIDIGRLLSSLAFINLQYPQYNGKIKAILSKWDFKSLYNNGEFYGAKVNKKGKELYVQEGRLGYEQYSAKAFSLFGIFVSNAMRYDRYLKFIDIYNIDIPYDLRDSNYLDANNYVLMEPYMLDGLEFGWDYYSKEFSYRLYKVQEERYKKRGILTAVTEDHIDVEPYFIYNSIFVNGEKWLAINDKGDIYNDKKLLSTKASFVMNILYHTDYTKKLLDKIKTLQSSRGWYGGIYEKSDKINKSLNCNTNAIILEALLYQKEGVLFQISKGAK
ncbi:hypothetical protein MNB_SV-15-128 [hydrothermal vent metagenome]|uniref:DUF3131 domain-containing protein n=1 Tax=hydrothermal vent metagenome TaxID=652676 RepID=A0A1W1EL24_9ZZZZ